MKWNFPHFTYKGTLCGMAAFKAHCAFGFWKGALVLDGRATAGDAAMGQFGRITKLADLPPKKTLAAYVKKAKQLNGAGVKPPKASKPKKKLAVPGYFLAALKKNKK